MLEVAAPIFPRLYLAGKEQWNDEFHSFRKVNVASTFDNIAKKKFPKNLEIRGRKIEKTIFIGVVVFSWSNPFINNKVFT